MLIFRRLRKFKATTLPGAEKLVFQLFIIYPRRQPTIAAHPSDTAPTMGAGAKIAPASPRHPPATVTLPASASF